MAKIKKNDFLEGRTRFWIKWQTKQLENNLMFSKRIKKPRTNQKHAKWLKIKKELNFWLAELRF